MKRSINFCLVLYILPLENTRSDNNIYLEYPVIRFFMRLGQKTIAELRKSKVYAGSMPIWNYFKGLGTLSTCLLFQRNIIQRFDEYLLSKGSSIPVTVTSLRFFTFVDEFRIRELIKVTWWPRSASSFIKLKPIVKWLWAYIGNIPKIFKLFTSLRHINVRKKVLYSNSSFIFHKH